MYILNVTQTDNHQLNILLQHGHVLEGQISYVCYLIKRVFCAKVMQV